jgi:serine/threonine protein kinase
MAKMVMHVPSRRISAVEAMRDPYFKEIYESSSNTMQPLYHPEDERKVVEFTFDKRPTAESFLNLEAVHKELYLTVEQVRQKLRTENYSSSVTTSTSTSTSSTTAATVTEANGTEPAA